MIKHIYWVIVFIIFAACCGARGPVIKAGRVPRINLVEIVFKSLDNKLVLAGPLQYIQEKGKDKLIVDFTTEFHNKKSDSVTFRFTWISKAKDRTFSTISIITEDTLFTSNSYTLMFKETHNKFFLQRYAFTTTYSVFTNLLEAEHPKFLLGSRYLFTSRAKWQKDSRKIKEKLELITSGYL